MQTAAALKPGCGLLALAPRRAGPAPRRALAVSAKGGKAPSDAPAPPPPPSDIPSYFQPAPVAPQQGQAYQAVPAPQYAPAPAPEGSFWSRIPPLVYIGVGVVLAGVLGKVMDLVKGGPQKMQQMAMEQMMKQMMKQMGAPPGGASPFGAAGGANPFGAAGGASPFGAGSASGFPSSFPNPPVFDTTATPAAPAAAAAAAAPAAPAAPAAETSSASSSAPAAEKPKKRSSFVDVGSSSGSSNSSSSSASTAEPAAAATGATGAASSSPPPPPPGGMPPPPFTMPPPPAGGAAAGAGAAAGGGMAGTMLEMLKNPEMQKMLYPYLPEPMRNQETFEWMLSNPEYRQQLEGMLQQQVASAGSPAMAEMMQGMDMSPEKMQAQFDALGMTPDQFIGKVMADPDLAGMMTNPKIMAAIAECTKNPMAIFNYQNDPEVLRVFEKMSQLFPQAAGAGALPTMPPGMGMPPGGMPPMPPTQQ